jgi:putative ABC transport system ATP-binding protein
MSRWRFRAKITGAPGPSPASIVVLRGVELTYPGPPPVRALLPTDLAIDAGQYVAVAGPSGSGKSTFLNVLGLLDRPTAGRYEFEGIDVAALGEAERTALRGRRIGFVFQSFHLLAYRSAMENVALGLLYTRTPRAARSRAAAEALSAVGLGHRRHALPTTLSGGESQRVAIARALIGSPALLLCDEPTGNLDSATAAGILDLLDQLHASGMTIVVITHDPAVAARAQRAVHIRDGRLTEGGHGTEETEKTDETKVTEETEETGHARVPQEHCPADGDHGT